MVEMRQQGGLAAVKVIKQVILHEKGLQPWRQHHPVGFGLPLGLIDLVESNLEQT
jgi:hypothetical protein